MPTMRDAVAITADCFAAEAVAVVLYVPELADVVALTTWTVYEPPAPRLAMLQASVWLGGVPPTMQDEPDWLATDQATPDPGGSDC